MQAARRPAQIVAHHHVPLDLDRNHELQAFRGPVLLSPRAAAFLRRGKPRRAVAAQIRAQSRGHIVRERRSTSSNHVGRGKPCTAGITTHRAALVRASSVGEVEQVCCEVACLQPGDSGWGPSPVLSVASCEGLVSIKAGNIPQGRAWALVKGETDMLRQLTLAVVAVASALRLCRCAATRLAAAARANFRVFFDIPPVESCRPRAIGQIVKEAANVGQIGQNSRVTPPPATPTPRAANYNMALSLRAPTSFP